ncbi:hypothetical protein [Xylanimonas sp. McL0601]|uniref:hypothetical protein n=1 Tax=Xylanimonas sp. McL0601 TaxID=3414739 RepID=UPI003CECCDAB
MPRLVVVPATPLLVPGASGSVDALAGLRDVVRGVLARELADVDGAVVVLGAGPTARAGRLRPTLGAAGIADGRAPRATSEGATTTSAPGVAGPAGRDGAVPWDGTASTGPSVALLALADAGVDLAARAVDVVEVPGEAPTAVVVAAADRLRSALSGGRFTWAPSGADSADGLLVVADQPAPGVDAVLEELTAAAPWSEEVLDVPQRHEHLPASYRVTVRRLTR